MRNLEEEQWKMRCDAECREVRSVDAWASRGN